MMCFDRDVTLPGNQLVMSDRCGMAFGLEYRPPLLGHDVVRAAAKVPASWHVREGAKSVWREVIAPCLPGGHLDNPKIGFNPPVSDWLAQVGAYLWGDEAHILGAIFDQTSLSPDRQKACWKRAISGNDLDMSLTIWALLVWRVWETLETGCPDKRREAGFVLNHAVAADRA